MGELKKPDTARVALVDPLAEINGKPAIFLRDNFGGQVPLGCAYPPLELAFTASVLRTHDVDVTIMPANVLGWHHAYLVEQLAHYHPDFVVIPSAWGSLDDDLRLAGIIKDRLPNAKVVMSGPNVAATYEDVLETTAVDFALLSEPEEAVSLLATGTNPGNIPNLAFRSADGIYVSPIRRPPPDWVNYPLPARDLLPLDRYTIPFARRLPATTMATTRGCGHGCNFCPTRIWNGLERRSRPLDLVRLEIEDLIQNHNIREISIRDDTFTADRDRVMAFCDLLLQHDYDLTWRCFGTADTVDAELLQTMARAGCVQVCYGFESGDDTILKRTGKGTTVEMGRAATRLTRAAGMEVAGTFLVGLQGESSATIDASIRFAIDENIDYVQVNVATPLPGTGFGKQQARAGRASKPNAFLWSGAATGETEYLSGEELARASRRFYRVFYFRPGYIWGRLGSRRGLRVLWAHAELAFKMVREMLPNPFSGHTEKIAGS